MNNEDSLEITAFIFVLRVVSPEGSSGTINDLQEMFADCDYAGESSNGFWFKGNGNYGVENFAHLASTPHWSMFRI